MKRLVLAAVLGCMMAGAAPRYTAEECRVKAKAGDEVRLSVAYLSAHHDGGRGEIEGFVLMTAHTYDRDHYGATIDVAVPEDAVDYYVERIGLSYKSKGHRGTKVKTRDVTGIVRLLKREYMAGEIMYVELELPASLRKEADKDKDKGKKRTGDKD